MLPPLAYAGLHGTGLSLSILELHCQVQQTTLSLRDALASPDSSLEEPQVRAPLWEDPEVIIPNYLLGSIQRERDLWQTTGTGSLPEKFEALMGLEMLYIRHRHSGGTLGRHVLHRLRRSLIDSIVHDNLFWSLVAPNRNGYDCFYLPSDIKRPMLLTFPSEAPQPPALFSPGASGNAAGSWAYVHVDHIAMMQDIVCQDCTETAKADLQDDVPNKAIVIVRDYRSERFYLRDGYHRLFAARQLGATYILGRVGSATVPAAPFQTVDSIRQVSHDEHMERIGAAGNLRQPNGGSDFTEPRLTW